MSSSSDIFHVLIWFELCETFAAWERKGGGVAVDMQELLTYEDVSRLTKFKISTLRKWVRLGKIPFSKINGSIRFNAEELRAWAAGEPGAWKSGGASAAVGGAGELFPEKGEEGQ